MRQDFSCVGSGGDQSVGRRVNNTYGSRVCEVTLFGEHRFEIKQQKYKVSDELKEGQANVLFGKCSI